MCRSAPPSTTSSRPSRARPTSTPRCTPASPARRATRASTRSPTGSRRWPGPRRATPDASPRASRASTAAETVKLELDDIVDLRAYERERPELQRRVFALKRRRRVAVGPIVTLLFENRDTIRFQIQEMARAEKMLRDEQILTELETYNPLIPEAGELSATLFIELTSKAELEEWLPKLVGIERSVELRVGDEVVKAEPEAAHEQQLTREDITAS